MSLYFSDLTTNQVVIRLPLSLTLLDFERGRFMVLMSVENAFGSMNGTAVINDHYLESKCASAMFMDELGDAMVCSHHSGRWGLIEYALLHYDFAIR